MSQGGAEQQPLQDPVPLPDMFSLTAQLTTIQQVTDDNSGVYVCVRCCLEDKPGDDEDTHSARYFDDKPSAITHRENTGHAWGWYHETVYKPFNDGFVHPDIVDAAQRLDTTIDTVELVEGTRDPRRNYH